MGLLRICKLAVLTAVAGCCAAMPARGIHGYLTQIGPPPLRFSLATARFSFALPPVLVEKPAPTNTAEIAATSTNAVETPAETNVVAQPSTPSLPTNTVAVAPNPNPEPNLVGTPSASDMLVVSPQMLTEFFKPGSNETNSANTTVVLPAPVGFTPPLAKPSSQAIYRSP